MGGGTETPGAARKLAQVIRLALVAIHNPMRNQHHPFPEELPLQHVIQQYSLDRGSLEIAYMEQYFPEFAAKKTSAELLQRLGGREHLILISLAPSPEDGNELVPVAFKVGHELRPDESEPQLADLTRHLADCVKFPGRRIFYSWIGGTRAEWRGQGHYRALTEQQEEWALQNGYDEIVVKTKNKFYAMRATLDHLRFDILKFEWNSADPGESKVYLHKKLSDALIKQHLTTRTVVDVV